MKNVANMLGPIKENIDYSIIGNHEEKYVKFNGFDIYDYFCSDLMPNCKKIGGLAVGNINFKYKGSVKSIRTAIMHGTGGGGYREGYPMNNCLDLFRKFRCDLHIMGHVHKLESRMFEYLTTDKNGKIIKTYVYYVIAGCFLETYVVGNKNYFEAKKGTPSDIGFIQYNMERSNGKWRTNLFKYRWINDRYELV